MTADPAPAPALDVPPAWAPAMAAVAAGARRVMVVGATDAGKSTFCRWLAAEAAASGRPAVLLDADPGQPDAAPPGCLARRRLPAPEAEDWVFLGVAEPMARRTALLEAVARLTAGAAAGDTVIVNTCGFVRRAGAALQAATARAADADLVIGLGPPETLADVARALAGRVPLLSVPKSPLARRRSSAARRRRREAALAAALAEARPRTLRAMVVEDAGTAPAEAGRLPPRLLCALADAGGRDRTLAVLLDLCPDPTGPGATARVLTALPPAVAVPRLRLGALTVPDPLRPADPS